MHQNTAIPKKKKTTQGTAENSPDRSADRSPFSPPSINYPSSSSDSDENRSSDDPTYAGLTRVQRSLREAHSPSPFSAAGGLEASVRISNNRAEDFGRHSVFYRSDAQYRICNAFAYALDPETHLPPPPWSSSSSSSSSSKEEMAGDPESPPSVFARNSSVPTGYACEFS